MGQKIQEEASIDAIDALLADGLELFAAQRQEDAIRAWTRVLEIAPGDPRALDYLEACGLRFSESETSTDPRLAPVIPIADRIKINLTDVRQKEIVAFVNDKRYEEALELLYRERATTPRDAAIAKAIRHVRDHLCQRYLTALGPLDRPLYCRDARPAETVEERAILSSIDGASTAEQIAAVSPMGRFRALRALARLFGGKDDAPDSSRKTSGTISKAPGAPPSSDGRALSPSSAPSSASLLPSWPASPPSAPPSAPPPSLVPPSSPAPSVPRPGISTTPAPAGLPTVPAPVPPLDALPRRRHEIRLPALPVPPREDLHDDAPVTAVRSALPLSQHASDAFHAVFDEAMRAYVARRYSEAIALFRECLVIRPGDTRAATNLARLEAMHPKKT